MMPSDSKAFQFTSNVLNRRIGWSRFKNAAYGTLLFIICALIPAYPGSAMGQFSLWLVEKRLDMKYDVHNITYIELKEKLDSGKTSDILIFDTREEKEYEESHIQSAIRVDPDMSSRTFIDAFADAIKGKHLVFYCSVGDRSSNFIQRVQDQAFELGALSLSNLRGGIFRWYNEGLPVYAGQHETNDIHPYDQEWGKLIDRRP
jgi:rhodanese-related sulfurtransferase